MNFKNVVWFIKVISYFTLLRSLGNNNNNNNNNDDDNDDDNDNDNDTMIKIKGGGGWEKTSKHSKN